MTLIGNKYHSTIKSKQLTDLLWAGFLLFTNIYYVFTTYHVCLLFNIH